VHWAIKSKTSGHPGRKQTIETILNILYDTVVVVLGGGGVVVGGGGVGVGVVCRYHML
jgi:hypothetical protein